jgi:hypothetical protein
MTKYEVSEMTKMVYVNMTNKISENDGGDMGQGTDDEASDGRRVQSDRASDRATVRWDILRGQWSWRCGTGCPLKFTPPSKKRRPDAVVGGIGLNLIELNSTDRMCLAAPGCLW